MGVEVKYTDERWNALKDHVEKYKQAYILGAACTLLCLFRGRKTQVTVVVINKEPS